MDDIPRLKDKRPDFHAPAPAGDRGYHSERRRWYEAGLDDAAKEAWAHGCDDEDCETCQGHAIAAAIREKISVWR